MVEETKEFTSKQETSPTLAIHEQNMVQFTAGTRQQAVNRRSELPVSLGGSGKNASRLIVPVSKE